jgi:hypothetical protein
VAFCAFRLRARDELYFLHVHKVCFMSKSQSSSFDLLDFGANYFKVILLGIGEA